MDALSESVKAEGYMQEELALLQATEKTLTDLAQNPDVTDTYRQRKQGEIMDALQARQNELDQRWNTRLENIERQARAGLQQGADAAFQAAKANGLTTLQLMAGSGNAQALLDTFEQVIARGIPGEVTAWAEALPLVLEGLPGHYGRGAQGVRVHNRAQAALEGLLTERQRQAQATLADVAETRDALELQRALRNLPGPTGGRRTVSQRARYLQGHLAR